MIQLRTFRNIDPPAVASLWRAQGGQPGLTQPVSVDLIEQLVFSKIYFDPQGLILAFDEDRPAGFAHAGFGPNEQRDGIDPEMGVTCVVILHPESAGTGLAATLLARSEEYLRDRGAKVLYGGGIDPLNPFYTGLYGGSELPGVLESDREVCQLFISHGYREIDRTVLLRRSLTGFEVPFDRRQMQLRRQMIVEVTADAVARDWWEASTLGDFDLTRFDVVPRVGGPPVATATFRAMEPVGSGGVGRRTGLVGLFVDPALRRRGLAVFILSEAFRQFGRQGITVVESQTMQHNSYALGLYRKLGFDQMGQGIVYRKT
ncbi:MAG: GNAT family N-acetyltransferase [Patescibacteria group bacterium]|nr:GNAT family N-acetyltransferase [Patescibacteria group bacterium]